MTWIRKESDGTHKSFNFIAPRASASEDVLFPIGKVLTPAFADELAVNIEQMITFLQPDEITGATTINLAINSQVTKGALLIMKLAADDGGDIGRIVTLGTGFDNDAGSVLVPNNRVIFLGCIFDGTSFVPMGSYDIDLGAFMSELEGTIIVFEGMLKSVEVLLGTDLYDPVYSETREVAVEQKETFFQPGILTGNMTINLTIDQDLPIGAKLYMKLTSDDQGQKTVTLGDGIGAPATVVIKSDTTAFVSFVYDGTEFIPLLDIPV